jgi:glutamate/tyrosine decarboxylase-like PLP-dependent enzyme
MELVLQTAFNAALAHLNGLDMRPVSAGATLEELRARLGKPLNQDCLDPQTVIEELIRDTRHGLLGSASGRFFAWVIGGSLPAALAADWLTSAWDQNSALYACAPAAAVVEEVAGRWLKEVLALPAAASFALVSGCQMAHATCLAAARHSLLAERGWDVERRGLFGAPPIRVLASSRHGSLERAVRLLGIGSERIIAVALDERERLQPAALVDMLRREPNLATIVALQAGDINTGTFDDYSTVIPLAKRYGAWVHLDGAFGLWVAGSPVYAHLLNGAAEADSWATDGHKWLNVPYDCGYAFVAHPASHRSAMSHRAPYLVHDLAARDQIDWNPEWSRRARGFATYAALRQLGRLGIADLIERCCAHAGALVSGLAALPGVQVLWQPHINQGLVRFLDPSPAATDMDHDRRTDHVIEQIVARGGAYFAGTTWRGMRAMRVSVINWRTAKSDIDQAIHSVAQALTL